MKLGTFVHGFGVVIDNGIINGVPFVYFQDTHGAVTNLPLAAALKLL